MGYNTTFKGRFKFNTTVSEDIRDYINSFCSVRHMKRDVERIKEVYPEWEKMCFDGNLGYQGEFFVADDDNFGQNKDDSIIDYNDAPSTVPGLWCNWRISEDCTCLEWDDRTEKFYNYIEWLEYLIRNFFAPKDIILNGMVEWQGENRNDQGKISVRDNTVTIVIA